MKFLYASCWYSLNFWVLLDALMVATDDLSGPPCILSLYVYVLEDQSYRFWYFLYVYLYYLVRCYT